MVNDGHPQGAPQCMCCEHSVPTLGPRTCPICGHQFQGNGWDGIDAHWRSRHSGVMSYEQFWSSLCGAHKGLTTRGDNNAIDSVVGKLVTHQPGTEDVSDYHGIPLSIEGNGASASRQDFLAIDDSVSILEGIARELTVMARSRSRKLRDLALRRSHGVCEACGTDFSVLLGGKGTHVLQVHHRRQLALQDAPKLTGPDDLAVVCANCHAIIHADLLSAMSVEALRDQWCRERAGAPNTGHQADG